MGAALTTLVLDDVTKVYGSGETAVTALKDVSFEANAGEVVVVMGPSGSGKTSLLTIAGALLRPTSGRVWICGTEVTEMDESKLAAIRRDKVGFIYQSFNLLESLTALENVRLVVRDGHPNSSAASARARELLGMLGLGPRVNSLPKTLSDGEKQRVAIARALAKNPALILADEPGANLDAKRGREVMELMRQKAVEMNKAVVIVSHDHRILEIADRVVWLEDGQIQASPPDSWTRPGVPTPRVSPY